jgi:plasmid maintenance system killer protein
MLNLAGARFSKTVPRRFKDFQGRLRVGLDVYFGSAAIAKLCGDPATRQRKLGPERAKKVGLRLDQMAAAANLAELEQLPQARCHELTGDRREQFSLDLDGPYRLIVEVGDEPIPRTSDGGIDREKVTILLVIEICDPH